MEKQTAPANVVSVNMNESFRGIEGASQLQITVMSRESVRKCREASVSGRSSLRRCRPEHWSVHPHHYPRRVTTHLARRLHVGL